MTDVLEDERDLRVPDLGTEKIIMIVLQLSIGEVVPPASLVSPRHDSIYME